MRSIHIGEKSDDVYYRDGSFVVCPMRSDKVDMVPCNAGCAWFFVAASISHKEMIHRSVSCGDKWIGEIVAEA